MFALLAWIHAAFAADASLALESAELREGQTVRMSLTVRDTSVSGVPELRVPPGLTARFESQSQSRTIINFESTVSTTYHYALTADRRGAYTLGPFDVVTRDGSLRTTPVTLSVGARTSGGNDTLSADLDVKRAWVGQVLVHHMRFSTERALVSASWGPPQAKGLTPEPTVQPVTEEGRLEEQGKPVVVQELFVPLRAVEEGAQVISGGVLQAQFATARRRRGSGDLLFEDLARFGDVRNESFAASPVPVDVRPLPSDGRPPDFSGLVGRFTLSAVPSSTRLAVGETLTLEVTLEGDGVLAGYALPTVQAEGFRVYDDQPVVTASLTRDGYRAKAVFKRAWVPQTAGTHTLPALELTAFDPVAGEYRALTTEPVDVTVTGSAGSAQVASYATPQKAEVGAQGEDILPLRTEATVSRPWSPGWSFALLVPGAALLLAQGASALAGAVRARAARSAAGPGELALPDDPEARLAAWEHHLRARVGARLGVRATAVRREDLGRLGDLAEEADACWKALEAARYGGAGALIETRLRALLEELAR
jgi:hypothetical protein